MKIDGEMRCGLFIDKLGCKKNKFRNSFDIRKKFLSLIFISSKLSQCKAKLEPTILSNCQSIGSNIAEQTRQFVEHIHLLK
jgi:hypothetical protein